MSIEIDIPKKDVKKLLKACKRGDDALVEKILCRHGNLDSLDLNFQCHHLCEIHTRRHEDRQDVIAIFQASKEGDDDTLKYILSRNEVNVNSLGCNSVTPLFYAISFNKPSTVRILLSHPDTRLDIADPNGWTALHFACAENNVECVKSFCADSRCTPEVLNMVDVRRCTAMMLTIVNGSLRCLREIEQYLAIDYAMDGSGHISLHALLSWAQRSNQEHIVKYLMEKKENVVTANKLSNMMLTDTADNDQEVEDVQEQNKRVRKEKICWNCLISSSSTQLLRCAGCRKARYCGEECQGKDMERHVEWCKKKERKMTGES